MPRSRFARHRHLILAVVTALLLGLLASMAYAATTHRSHSSGGYGYSGYGYGYGGYGYGGYGYGGYGYGGYGYGGYGYGYGYGHGSGCTTGNHCPNAQYLFAGRVMDSAKYADEIAHGVPTYRALVDAAVPGASVTLERSLRGGPWVTLPATSVGGTSPQAADAYGTWAFFARGTGRVRAAATAPGYEAGYSAAHVANGPLTEMDVWLTPVAPPAGGTTTTGGGTTTDTTNNGGGGTTTTTPTVPTTPVTPVTPGRPAGPVRAAGCAAKKGSARAACERAAKLATALRSCTKTYKKGSRRTLCERRARALSACDAGTAKKRKTCRAKALELGKKKTTKKAASKHAAHR
jgi:hypothetical protein